MGPCFRSGDGDDCPKNKKPGLSAGLLFSIRRTLSGRFVRHGGVVAVGFDIGLVGFTVGLGTVSVLAPRRGLLASWLSISLTASVSVECWTTAISRDRRSSAAS